MFYYNEYVCTGPADDEADARKSFPSGHASVVCFVASFVAVYLQRRSSAAVSAVFLLRPIIQVGNTTTVNSAHIGIGYTVFSVIHALAYRVFLTSCVGINLGDIPRGLQHPWDVPSVDPSTIGRKTLYELASLKYCYIMQVLRE